MAGRPLNATAASLLGFLHEGPKTGWDLVTTAQERIGKFWSLTTSQVYRELSAMERDGLIEAGETGPRARKPYALTDDGRRAFADGGDIAWGNPERDPLTGARSLRVPRRSTKRSPATTTAASWTTSASIVDSPSARATETRWCPSRT
mgnify:CR=1 FL=1